MGGTVRGIRVLLGGAEWFSEFSRLTPAGIVPQALAISDFNSDGNADVVATDPALGVVLLPGNGDGTFQPTVYVYRGSGLLRVCAADVNGDAKPDLVIADQQLHGVQVLLNQSGGNFGPATLYAAGYGPRAVAVADFNGDGRTDLAIFGYYAAIDVLWNDLPALAPLRTVSPPDGAVIRQNDPASGCTADAVIGAGFRIGFEWSAPASTEVANGYDLRVGRRGAAAPALELQLGAAASYSWHRCAEYIPDDQLENWQWRVRARGPDGAAREWSTISAFRFDRCRLADGRACGTAPPSGSFAVTGAMNVTRADHTATLLPDGRVLVAFGQPSPEADYAELFDPQTGRFLPTGKGMNRSGPTATLLADGKVLFCGGMTSPANCWLRRNCTTRQRAGSPPHAAR